MQWKSGLFVSWPEGLVFLIFEERIDGGGKCEEGDDDDVEGE